MCAAPAAASAWPAGRRLLALTLLPWPPLGRAVVSCGGHHAASCSDCPRGGPEHGWTWCIGECTWRESEGRAGSCEPVLEDQAAAWLAQKPMVVWKVSGNKCGAVLGAGDAPAQPKADAAASARTAKGTGVGARRKRGSSGIVEAAKAVGRRILDSVDRHFRGAPAEDDLSEGDCAAAPGGSDPEAASVRSPSPAEDLPAGGYLGGHLALDAGTLCAEDQRVRSFDECKAACRTLQVQPKVHPLPINDRLLPEGCFMLEALRFGIPTWKLHFNAHPGGAGASGRIRPICRLRVEAASHTGVTSGAPAAAGAPRDGGRRRRRCGGRRRQGAADPSCAGGAGGPATSASRPAAPAAPPRPGAPGAGAEAADAVSGAAGTLGKTLPIPARLVRLVEFGEPWSAVAVEVRGELLHAWEGYRKHAWGADELRPLTRRGLNSFGGVAMSILDALTTLWVMDLPEEFEEAAKFVEHLLQFGGVDQECSVFELTIRALGGLLGAHSLTSRGVFLERARELADLLLPAFNTTSGIPVSHWNLHRGTGTSDSCRPTLLAEAGSIQLEWRYLSEHTGDARYQEAADGAFRAVQSAGARGLLPVHLTPPSFQAGPRFLKSKVSTGGEADSYYEYLLKQWLQSPREEQFKRLFLDVMDELPNLVRPRATATAQNYSLVMIWPNGRTEWKMEHLSCFVPGTIALGLMALPPEEVERRDVWIALAEGLTRTCVQMWTSSKSGLAPEHIMMSEDHPHGRLERQSGRHSYLRPETAESLFYMFRLTGRSKYRRWGLQILRAIQRQSRVRGGGYASVRDSEKEVAVKTDEMHSFVLAETFKYLYLLFAPEDLLDLDRYVLNTEAHPLQRSAASQAAAPVRERPRDIRRG